LEQTIQGNAHGGKDTNNAFRYSGSWDLRLKFDTGRMELWPGGLLEVHGESFFGQSINRKSGGTPNDDALYPVPGDRDVMLSHVVYTQFLSESFGVFLGKLDTTTGDKNEFAWIHGDNFLHSALRWNLINARTTPYSTLGAGFFFVGDWGMWSFTGYDTEGAANVSGFDTAFDGGTSLATEARFNLEPFGKPGHQLFGFTWSDKDFVSLEQDPRAGIDIPDRPILDLLTLDLSLGRESSSWSFYYNFDQYLYVEPEDPTQGVGIFGRFGISDGEANPIETFYSLGVGGTGIIPERDRDTFGLGYYFVDYGGELPDRLGVRSSQGVELFYNIEVAPWLHITPDLQVMINPGGFEDRDVAIVYGLRAQMSF
ncbi:MAG: carbohydrate porin, partial [Phycisphaerales bacterium]